ncbi:hypothetical protein DFP72DRAFT_1069810 [Ephemerocybe angulata]|uniref:MYND-type domain-containing protein n=1 Tax=Ephemerocybe angulata TaxID=980116 RepID=A0A8H6M6D5_9AGAR|nr:hypothetical protein DFP72DRAFT_1069810 [Tulosesus angulatus]
MPGSRSRYSLDLDDIIAFPDIAHVPVFGPKDGESWYILLEVTQNMSLGRPVFQVEDKLKGNFWMVAFYTDNPREDAKDVEVGSTICIRDGMPHQFLDGRMGYRIEDASSVIVLPCSMAILRTINQALRKRSDDGLLLCCVMCNKPVKRGCISCKTRYCSKECQKENWKTHKQVCKVLKTLHEWNRTDWG